MKAKILLYKAKTLLYNHIKNLDYHSARESKNPFKWNTPVMNEFIAFGRILLEDAQQEIKEKDFVIREYKQDLLKRNETIDRLGQLCTNQRHKIEKIEACLEKMRQHIDNEIPVFTMPFLNGDLDAVSKYVQKMDKWVGELKSLLEDQQK